jgi:hypothetical protein
VQNLKVEAGMARELQSPGWRFQKRHSGEWRSQGRQRKANGNGSREGRRERWALRAPAFCRGWEPRPLEGAAGC